MNWKKLESEQDLEQAIEESKDSPVMLFKHSTTCSISSTVLSRLERKWDLDIPAYFLDLRAHRDISQAIAERFDIRHESPQALLIADGKCQFHESHMGITVDAIKKATDK